MSEKANRPLNERDLRKIEDVVAVVKSDAPYAAMIADFERRAEKGIEWMLLPYLIGALSALRKVARQAETEYLASVARVGVMVMIHEAIDDMPFEVARQLCERVCE